MKEIAPAIINRVRADSEGPCSNGQDRDEK